jgi:hypothetical protein
MAEYSEENATDAGREALARLQFMILKSREIANNGGNLEVLYEEHVEDLVAALWMLDLYLTRKTDGRNHKDDAKMFFNLFVNAKAFHVHLSDGGYSRLSIFLEDGHPLVLDRSLSRDPVKKKWAALFPPS